MKLKFKKQAFQTDAVNAVADCFAGQPKSVTDRPKGAGHDRPKGATRRGCFWVSGVVKSSLKDPFCQALFS